MRDEEKGNIAMGALFITPIFLLLAFNQGKASLAGVAVFTSLISLVASVWGKRWLLTAIAVLFTIACLFFWVIASVGSGGGL